jgi:hypothetical protein
VVTVVGDSGDSVTSGDSDRGDKWCQRWVSVTSDGGSGKSATVITGQW